MIVAWVTPYYVTQSQNVLARSFYMILKITTFAVMIIWNVMRAGKSWQVSPGSGQVWSCILWHIHQRSLETWGRRKPVWWAGAITSWFLCKQVKGHSSQWNKLLIWWNLEDIESFTFLYFCFALLETVAVSDLPSGQNDTPNIMTFHIQMWAWKVANHDLGFSWVFLSHPQ